VESADGEIRIPGKVSAIASGSDLSTGSFSVVITADNDPSYGLLSGMSARVSIEPRASEPAVIIPSSSVVSREGKSYVFIAEKGAAKSVEIESAPGIGNRTVVSSGLSGGEILIVSGLNGMKPGRPVSPVVIGESGVWK